MWKSREVAITKTNSFGLDRTIRVLTTDLAIPCRKVKGGFHLEDGVMPVTSEAYRAILDFSETQPNEELSLMLAIGFGTGLRIGSIVDLKVETIEKATIDPFTNWRCIEVGPAARPLVSTKMDMSGKVPFVVDSLRIRTLEYAKSTRRLLRQSMARKEHRCLLFLNEDGAPFNQGSVTTAMCRLRAKAIAQGRTEFRGFYFHRSRATFATLLMRAALEALSVSDAIDLVRNACLHSSAATTLEYVKFIEQSTSMREHADAFTSAFLGINKRDSRNA
jgi:integrase